MPPDFRRFENEFAFARNTWTIRQFAIVWRSALFKKQSFSSYFSTCDWVSNGMTNRLQPSCDWVSSAQPLRPNRAMRRLLSQQPSAFWLCRSRLCRKKMAFFFSISLENNDRKSVTIFYAFRTDVCVNPYNFMPRIFCYPCRKVTSSWLIDEEKL